MKIQYIDQMEEYKPVKRRYKMLRPVRSKKKCQLR